MMFGANASTWALISRSVANAPADAKKAQGDRNEAEYNRQSKESYDKKIANAQQLGLTPGMEEQSRAMINELNTSWADKQARSTKQKSEQALRDFGLSFGLGLGNSPLGR